MYSSRTKSDSMVIQVNLGLIISCLLFFDVRTSRSYVLPLVGVLVYALASIPPGMGPEGPSFAIPNAFLTLIVSYISWSGRYAIEHAERVKWAESARNISFCGRFDLISPENPEHETPSSVVIRAVDTMENDDQLRDVVIKLVSSCFYRLRIFPTNARCHSKGVTI